VYESLHYIYLSECELDAVLNETRADYQNGKYVAESPTVSIYGKA
jgi:hypothetical protein